MAHILLADDHPSLLATLGQVLRLEGHQVTSTNNGADVLCLLRRDPPHDLLILDVQMPGLSGTEVVARLGPTAPPVILMTGSDQPMLDFPAGKVVRVLRKSFGWAKLVGAVDQALGVENPRTCCEDDDRREWSNGEL